MAAAVATVIFGSGVDLKTLGLEAEFSKLRVVPCRLTTELELRQLRGIEGERSGRRIRRSLAFGLMGAFGFVVCQGCIRVLGYGIRVGLEVVEE
ncbi:hypothetical protein Droror1_Dr00014811 [Drosera rotundifolia]